MISVILLTDLHIRRGWGRHFPTRFHECKMSNRRNMDPWKNLALHYPVIFVFKFFVNSNPEHNAVKGATLTKPKDPMTV